MRLVGLLVMDLHARPVRGRDLGRRRRARVRRGQVAEERRDLLDRVLADVPAETDDHPFRLVPAVEVAEERLACRPADRLLPPDDVPAEGLVAVEELLVHPADEVAW